MVGFEVARTKFYNSTLRRLSETRDVPDSDSEAREVKMMFPAL